MKKNIILIGFMASGKTSVGNLLAEKLKYKFLDFDIYIEKKEKQKINDIFSIHGEKYFRKLEKETIKDLREVNNFVISTGGGTFCNQANIRELKKIGKTVYLKTSYDEIKKRLSEAEIAKRPLLKNKSNLIDKLNSRQIFYNQADITINTDRKSIEEIAKEICKIIQ